MYKVIVTDFDKDLVECMYFKEDCVEFKHYIKSMMEQEYTLVCRKVKNVEKGVLLFPLHDGMFVAKGMGYNSDCYN